jgi:hypothetical protein
MIAHRKMCTRAGAPYAYLTRACCAGIYACMPTQDSTGHTQGCLLMLANLVSSASWHVVNLYMDGHPQVPVRRVCSTDARLIHATRKYDEKYWRVPCYVLRQPPLARTL